MNFWVRGFPCVPNHRHSKEAQIGSALAYESLDQNTQYNDEVWMDIVSIDTKRFDKRHFKTSNQKNRPLCKNKCENKKCTNIGFKTINRQISAKYKSNESYQKDLEEMLREATMSYNFKKTKEIVNNVSQRASSNPSSDRRQLNAANTEGCIFKRVQSSCSKRSSCMTPSEKFKRKSQCDNNFEINESNYDDENTSKMESSIRDKLFKAKINMKNNMRLMFSNYQNSSANYKSYLGDKSFNNEDLLFDKYSFKNKPIMLKVHQNFPKRIKFKKKCIKTNISILNNYVNMPLTSKTPSFIKVIAFGNSDSSRRFSSTQREGWTKSKKISNQLNKDLSCSNQDFYKSKINFSNLLCESNDDSGCINRQFLPSKIYTSKSKSGYPSFKILNPNKGVEESNSKP